VSVHLTWLRFAWAGALALAAAACGGSTAVTEVSGPDAVRCQTTVSSPPAALPAGGARLTLTVTAARECAWTAASEASWLQVSPGSGQGGSAITLTVAANPEPRARTGALVLNDNRLSLTQEAAPCRYTVSPLDLRFSNGGGRITVQVSTLAGCSWRASAGDAWARVAPDSGTGGGTVEVEVPRNTSVARSTTLRIADAAVNVQQDAAGTTPSPGPAPPPGPTPPPPEPGTPACTGSIEPDSRSFEAAGGDGLVAVVALPTCSWTTSSNAGWISILTGGGIGPGLVRYRVAANTSATERTATLTIAGRGHTVRQAGAAASEERRVDFRGVASHVAGACPTVSFAAAGYIVVTDAETRWKGEDCRDLRNGVEVKVEGTLANGRVRASKVEIND